MFKLISAALIVCALSAGAAVAQTQDATNTTQDRQAQEQAERDRKQAERERKEKDKDARKEPGTRCGRWKRGKA
jgi:Ni/Co efflux regulator RcnB